MNSDAWLNEHAYLRPIARFCEQVESAAAGVEIPRAPIPDWDEYASDYSTGVPLLQSFDAAIDLWPASSAIGVLAEKLARAPLTEKLTQEMRALDDALRREPESSRHVAAWLLGDDAFVPAAPGLLRYLGWAVMQRYLASVLPEYQKWRQEERWLRSYCPTCGSPPAMAQLVGIDPGRLRMLSCGCCRTRWRFNRTTCPFCEVDTQRLAGFALEREPRLRIDYCESCRGYLKTYMGEGDERFLLADWTSLHLDLVAQDRGLKRSAGSLFDLGSEAELHPQVAD
jgi:FdhE protein